MKSDLGKAMNENTHTFQNSWIRQLGQYNSHFTHQASCGVGTIIQKVYTEQSTRECDKGS